MRASIIALGLAGMLATVAWPAAAIDVPALVAAAPDADAHPDADIVVLHRAETIAVDDAGLVTRHVHTVRRLQTQWAIRSRADVRLAWDDARQDLEIRTARTYMRDGAVRETPANGFNDVTPDAVARAVPFLDVRELVVSHIGTEPGCVVELEYVVRDLAPAPLPPGGTVWLGGEHPVLHAEVRCEGADAVPLGVDAAPVTAGHWIVTDLPAYREVPRSQRALVVPHVRWGRAHAADRLAAAVRSVTEAAAAPGPALAAWIERTRADQDVLTDADLIDRIAALAHDGLQPVRLPGGIWARAPRPAEGVFTSAVATPWEQAVVTLAALRAAGLDPELGLFGRDALPGRGPLDPARFTHLRVTVRMADTNWWLGADRAAAWPDHCDLAGLTGVMLGADAARVYEVPSRPRSCRWTVALTPGDDGWTATADLVLAGLDPEHAAAHDVAEALAGRLLVGGELATVDVGRDEPTTLRCRFTARGESLADASGDVLWYTLPWPAAADLDHALAGVDLARAERRFPLQLRTGLGLDLEIRVQAPPGWRFDHAGAGEHGLAAGPLTLQGETKAPSPRELTRRLRLDLDPGEVEPNDWPAFRDAVAAVRRAMKQPVVLVNQE